MFTLMRAAGALALIAGLLLGLSTNRAWASNESSCAPAITTTTQPIRRADGAIVGLDVSTQAAASRPGGDQLVSVAFTRAVNGRVEIDGRAGSLPSTIMLPSPRTWTFRLNRVDVTQPFHVDYTVRDLCGDVTRFAGAGMADGRPSTTPDEPPPTTMTPSPSPSPSTTVTVTSTPTGTVTVSPSPTVTVTATVTPSPTAPTIEPTT